MERSKQWPASNQRTLDGPLNKLPSGSEKARQVTESVAPFYLQRPQPLQRGGKYPQSEALSDSGCTNMGTSGRNETGFTPWVEMTGTLDMGASETSIRFPVEVSHVYIYIEKRKEAWGSQTMVNDYRSWLITRGTWSGKTSIGATLVNLPPLQLNPGRGKTTDGKLTFFISYHIPKKHFTKFRNALLGKLNHTHSWV